MDNSNLYSGFRYPAEIISHAVWLYFRFSLSFRDVEELLASRASSFPTRPFASGRLNSASCMPMRYAASNQSAVTSGISTRWY